MLGAHRKVVTVLFCDVVGSTALGESVDPEALQGLLGRYFERMKRIVESHGGSVEKFIGDAVMAVFGVPVAHEDDALRACRAAVEMREALPDLGVKGRIGVNTGEVLAGMEERLATGDAVNVAARLEQSAESGEVLIGAETLALVEAAVEVGDERLLELKGKSELVAAHPLIAIVGMPERSHASRFVGREHELQQLTDAWDRAVSGPRCELVTIVGEPGVGKSRLVAEVLERIDAQVVRGRCLSYGEGITYWPVVEVLKALDALPSDEQAATAIRSLLGENDTASGTDEIAWAFRKLLEERAPLVVGFDDIQWGEETFLDLLEATGLLSTGAPLLLVCMARPELLDRRPRWPVTLQLEPLGEEDADALVGDGMPDEVRLRIVHASGGNPLFLTEMLALAGDGNDVEVPATLRALLAARLDQLDQQERGVLERGSVEGELFHRGAVQALAPEEAEVTPRLAALVRRDLVRPDAPQLPREDAYRFRHLLIRDAAYDALPKATRADLHRRFAGWLEEHGQTLVELDEILGYHLEQAARYLAELGRPDERVALAAGERLAAAGRRAHFMVNPRAAGALLDRALALTRPYRLDVHLEVALAWDVADIDGGHAVAVADAAAERATAVGDEAAAALARTIAALVRAGTGTGSAAEEERAARVALPLLEAREDDEGLDFVWRALADVANLKCRFEEVEQASERSLFHAGKAGHPRVGLRALPMALIYSPRPAREALAKLDSLLPDHPHPLNLLARAVLLAMLDEVEQALEVARSADQTARELGVLTLGPHRLAQIAQIAGDHEAAASYLRALCELQEGLGDAAGLSSMAPELGRVLWALGSYDEAESFADKGRGIADPDDLASQALWRQAQALVHAARGQHVDADGLAREAVALVDLSDSPVMQGEALCDLAEVLEAGGQRDEAIATWSEALDRYERKGIVPIARRIRKRLAVLQATQASE